jgi:hypothetical protein
VLILAYISMLIDHIGIVFFPGEMLFRLIGRLALPIFAIRLSNGYDYTKNFNNYFMRILLLGIISQPIYSLVFGIDFFEILNICFFLAYGLLSINIIDKVKNISENRNIGHVLQLIAFIILVYITYFFSFEYGLYGLFMVISVHFFKKDIVKFIAAFSLVSFVLIPGNMHPIQYLPLLLFPFLFYLDEKKFLNIDMKILGFKYAHYLFYPLHLLLLYIIKILYV